MLGMKSIWLSLFVFFSFSNLCMAERIDANQGKVIEEKIYILPDQMILSKEGIFLITDRGLGLITQLNWDENGYYTGNIEFKRCDNGHPQVCLDCHGCGNKKCIYRCNCYWGPRQD